MKIFSHRYDVRVVEWAHPLIELGIVVLLFHGDDGIVVNEADRSANTV